MHKITYLNINPKVSSWIGSVALKARFDDATSPVVAASLSKKGSEKKNDLDAAFLIRKLVNLGWFLDTKIYL